MKIYLAGPIRGLSYHRATAWREEIRLALEDLGHRVADPMRGKEFLSEERVIRDAYEDNPLSSTEGIYGRDTFDITQCDVLLANLLHTDNRVSLGTVMEIQLGRDLGKYVLVILEKGNIHDHPFVRRAASLIVHDLEAAIHVLAVLGGPYI